MNIIIKKTSIVAKYLFAVIVAFFGVQHFKYNGYIAHMVPGWIPFHQFWVYFTGAGFVAAALSIFLNWKAKWGSFLLGTMILIFVLTIHVPNLIHDHFSSGDLSSAASDLSVGCCAFVLSGILGNELK